MRTMLRSLCILRMLCRSEGPACESFVQNGIFLLQEAMGEDLGCSFYLDRQGPRSRETFDSLICLEQEGKITISGSSQGFVVAITESGKRFINQGGEWGPFFDVPPVRVPEGQIDAIFTLLCKDVPIGMECLGTALYLALSADSSGALIERLKKAKAEGKLAEELGERSVVEGYRRLKRYGIRFVK